MALDPVAALVIGHGNAAIDALDAGAATAAQDRPGIAAAVDQNESLRFVGEALLDSSVKRRRYRAGLVRLLKILAHIDDFDAGERTVLDARGDSNQFVFSAESVVVGFKGRCGRAEEGEGAFALGADDGHIAAVITGRFFLLVAIFLLFVDDDKAKIHERRKNSGASADDDAGFTVADAPPFAGTFDVAQRRMEYGDTFVPGAKPRAALAADPESERDFRDEDDGGFAARESLWTQRR